MVALDGSGQFCSVQGATDALPKSSSKATVIAIAPGLYHEILHVSGKSNVTLHGQDRKQTVILGTNNNSLNPSTATRSLVGFDKTNGLVIENLTNAVLSMARVAIGYRCDNMVDFQFKDMSVRSIDPSKPLHPTMAAR
jgi:pectin methylesterase-like acyl-CoA thioesterase